MGLRSAFVALAIAGCECAVAIIHWAPPLIGFGLAAAAAITWCLWLEQHPDP